MHSRLRFEFWATTILCLRLSVLSISIVLRWVQAVDSIHPSGVLLYELEGKEFSTIHYLGLVGIVSVADLRISRFGELLKMAERVNFALKLGPSGPAPARPRGKTGPHSAHRLPTQVGAVPAVHLAPRTGHGAARNRRNAKSIRSIFCNFSIDTDLT